MTHFDLPTKKNVSTGWLECLINVLRHYNHSFHHNSNYPILDTPYHTLDPPNPNLGPLQTNSIGQIVSCLLWDVGTTALTISALTLTLTLPTLTLTLLTLTLTLPSLTLALFSQTLLYWSECLMLALRHWNHSFDFTSDLEPPNPILDPPYSNLGPLKSNLTLLVERQWNDHLWDTLLFVNFSHLMIETD